MSTIVTITSVKLNETQTLKDGRQREVHTIEYVDPTTNRVTSKSVPADGKLASTVAKIKEGSVVSLTLLANVSNGRTYYNLMKIEPASAEEKENHVAEVKAKEPVAQAAPAAKTSNYKQSYQPANNQNKEKSIQVLNAMNNAVLLMTHGVKGTLEEIAISILKLGEKLTVLDLTKAKVTDLTISTMPTVKNDEVSWEDEEEAPEFGPDIEGQVF
jgi:translation elongation factor P/translation initiation factor 5A